MKAWVVLLAIVSAIHTAHADPKADARAHVAAADTSYKLGDFAKALDDYQQAYKLFPVPALLFNIGQCHRQLKQYERALFFFEGFLRDSAPNAPNRDVVEGLAAEMRAAMTKQQAEEAAAAAEEHRRAEEERAHADEEARRRAAEEAAQRRAAEDDARRQAQLDEARRAEAEHDRNRFYKQWWFWTAVGGAVAIAGGTAYYFSGSTTIVEPSGSLGGLDRR